MNSTIQTVRGCGIRDSGKAYLCCGTGPEGLKIEHFIIDPVVPWDIEGHTRGYSLMEKEGINHVVIFVGKGFYPSPWDFVEEARLYGLSRKVGDNFPFEKLIPGKSRMYFAHARAIPTFKYSLVTHPSHCDYTTPGYPCGYHEKFSKKLLELFNSTPCTFGLRSLAVFHNRFKSPQSGFTYKIQKQSYSYNVIAPLTATILNERYTVYHVNQGIQLNQTNSPLETIIPLYPQAELYKAPVTYAKEYGIFMWAPITHVEAKNSLPQPVKEKVHLAGYHTEILDY